MARRGPESKNSPRILDAAQRRNLALKLRIEGFTLREIAKQVGVKTEGAVSKMLSHELSRVAAMNLESAEDLRAIQLEQIGVAKQKAIAAISRASGADTVNKATNALVRLLEREAKLLGLDVGTGASAPAAERLEIVIRRDDGWQG